MESRLAGYGLAEADVEPALAAVREHRSEAHSPTSAAPRSIRSIAAASWGSFRFSSNCYASSSTTSATGVVGSSPAVRPKVTATVHPSFILRTPDSQTRRREFDQLVADLKKVARYIRVA